MSKKPLVSDENILNAKYRASDIPCGCAESWCVHSTLDFGRRLLRLQAERLAEQFIAQCQRNCVGGGNICNQYADECEYREAARIIRESVE